MGGSRRYDLALDIGGALLGGHGGSSWGCTTDGFYIDNVAVRPSVKGQGVGRALLQLAETEAVHRTTNPSIWQPVT